MYNDVRYNTYCTYHTSTVHLTTVVQYIEGYTYYGSSTTCTVPTALDKVLYIYVPIDLELVTIM